jgi:hypothetical protein
MQSQFAWRFSVQRRALAKQLTRKNGWPRGSLASRGSIMGGSERAIATPSSMQSGMRTALSSGGGSRRSALEGLDQSTGRRYQMPSGRDSTRLAPVSEEERRRRQPDDDATAAAPPGSPPRSAKLAPADRWDSPLIFAPR